MKIATWNVNSIRTRLGRLIAWLSKHQPDVLCLQELKCQEHQFPFEEIAQAGYHAVMLGQKTYNGVAILSKSEPTDVRRGLILAQPDGESQTHDPQARLISAEFNGVRIFSIYVPNGSDMTSDKYTYKLGWLDSLVEMLQRDYSPDQFLIICGDTNIIARDIDSANPEIWKTTGLGCDEIRQKFDKLCQWGLVDILAQQYPEGGIFSWWDYRNLGFQLNDGLRLDHILATRSLAERCSSITVDRDERKGEKPSDHAPVIAVFE